MSRDVRAAARGNAGRVLLFDVMVRYRNISLEILPHAGIRL